MKQQSNARFERISRTELKRILSRLQQANPKSGIKDKQVEKREPYSVRAFK